jgi:hypothetical protein
MQLFTVKMIAKRIISLFDFNGDKTGERVEEIPQVYRDLPAQTAQTYKRQFPDNKVEIEAQTPEPVRGSMNGGARYERGPKTWPKPHAVVVDSKGVVKKVPIKTDTLAAAQTGDMAAAINAEMKS